MGSNFKLWWRPGGQKMPLVQRDIRRFSSADRSLRSDRSNGRFAKSDEVASCLLRRDYADAMPVRHEVQLARNRRRLKLLFALMISCWIVGRIFI